jgi:hypothetical protein
MGSKEVLNNYQLISYNSTDTKPSYLAKPLASDLSLLLVRELSGKIENTEITKLTNKIIQLLNIK